MKIEMLGYRFSIEKLVEELQQELNAPPPKPSELKKPRRRKCLYREKVCYTREDAAEAATHIKNPQIRIYCCEFCHQWHLTHKKNNTRRKP